MSGKLVTYAYAYHPYYEFMSLHCTLTSCEHATPVHKMLEITCYEQLLCALVNYCNNSRVKGTSA